MDINLPISLALFTSTKGHFGRRTDWRLTLDHWNRQVPLANFGRLIAHIKISVGDEEIGARMAEELTVRGFKVLATVADWTRGLSHGANYMQDMVTVSKDKSVYDQPYFMLLEDDSLACSHQASLSDLILQSCDWLKNNHELLTVRLMRRCDDRGPVVNHHIVDRRWFWSEDVNFQPLIMRSLDFYRLSVHLERNPNACQSIQCERFWRLILDGFSRSPHKHLVYEPDFAETIHIGVNQDDHERLVQQYSLT